MTYRITTIFSFCLATTVLLFLTTDKHPFKDIAASTRPTSPIDQSTEDDSLNESIILAFNGKAIDRSYESYPAYSTIMLSDTSITMVINSRYYVRVSHSIPDGANEDSLTYTSSNHEVVIAEDGAYFRALAPGDAKITVRAKNGAAKAYLNVSVVNYDERLTIYDATHDAKRTTQKAPAVDCNALEYPQGNMQHSSGLSSAELQKKYAPFQPPRDGGIGYYLPDDFVQAPIDDPLGACYALFYTLLDGRLHSRSYGPVSLSPWRGLTLLGSQLPGITQEDMATVRTWLHESFDGLIFGSYEDFFGNTIIFDDASNSFRALDDMSGEAYRVNGIIQINETCYVADISWGFGSHGCGYNVLFERTKDGWKIDSAGMTFMA